MRCERFLLGIVVAAVGLASVNAQTTDAASQTVGAKKDCSLPRAFYSPSPALTNHPSKDSGVASIDVTVDEKGMVSDAKILESSASKEFNENALAAVKKWKFHQSYCVGKPAPAHVKVQIESHSN